MKVKHNKLRNSGLLFELLVRQVTTDTLNNKDSRAVEILKKYFNNTEIAKEYKIYDTLTNAKNLSEQKAEILISAAVSSYKKLNKNSLKKQKYDLISEVKQYYDLDEFFSSKVNNYKSLASIYLLFEMEGSEYIDTEKYAECKYTILESIVHKPAAEDKDQMLEDFISMDKGTRSLVYKLVLEKFNEKYSDLDLNQKALLKEYINNISTTDQLKDYVNEQFIKVKKELDKLQKDVNSPVREVKINEIINMIVPISKNKKVTDSDIHNLLYYYELIKEIKALNEKK